MVYDNNEIICYYSAEKFQEKISKDKTLSSLGLVPQQKTKEKWTSSAIKVV